MVEEKIEKIYRILRVAIFALPVIAVAAGLYLILFPVDSYSFFPDDPKLSKIAIEENTGENQLSFGVFPLRDYRYIDLSANLQKTGKKQCPLSGTKIYIKKTYKAFEYPSADQISNEDQLKEILFKNNKTKYPNGSLLHLKPTNEVFVISDGKKILFPGPEIFEAFGYSFDNLIDVDQSEIDLYPDADQRVFLWTMAHPDGTIFISYPSHALFIASDGKKMQIQNEDLLRKIWPDYHAIVVSDTSGEGHELNCMGKDFNEQLSCQFDSQKITTIGRYYFFSLHLPDGCSVGDFQPGRVTVKFVSDHSWSTAKESMRTIAASVFNRYFFKQ